MATVERNVEVRSWPEPLHLKVLDLDGWFLVDDFPLWGDRAAPAWDPLAPYAARTADAITRLESDQEQLRLIFRIDDESTRVHLRPDAYSRQTMDALLRRYGLNLDEVETARIDDVIGSLYDLDLDDLYELLVDWVDVVERRLYEGACAAMGEPWLDNSSPAQASNFLKLVCGLDDHSRATDAQRVEAFELFQRTVDVDLGYFSFAYLLRWVYYSRSEFGDCQPFELRAVEALRAARESET